MTRNLPLILWTSLLILPAGAAGAPKPSPSNPEAQFAATVQPFLAANCVGCHNSKLKTANLDLRQFDSVESVRANLKIWRKVAWKLEQGEMPPAKTPQPKPAAKKAVLRWVHAELANAPAARK